jgi:hypothetical protein
MVSGSSSAFPVQFTSSFGFPREDLLRTAWKLADGFPPKKARRFLGGAVDATCRSDLSEVEREELLDTYVAARARSRLDFLEGSGLIPDPEVAGCYLPGMWRLSSEDLPTGGWCFVIHGVRAASGEVVSVRLTVKQFSRAGLALRALKKAVGAGEQIRLTAAEWNRIWCGFRHRKADGSSMWVGGLRSTLWRDAEEGE